MRFFFKNAKKSCVNQATQPRSQGSLLAIPKEREPGNEVFKATPQINLPKLSTQKTPKFQTQKILRSFPSLKILRTLLGPWGRVLGDSLVKHTVGAKERQSGRCPYVIRPS